MFFSTVTRACFAGFALASLTTAGVVPRADECRCLPQDSCWPSTETWDALNSTVGGRLVATIPIGTPCHAPNYDEAACEALQDSWTLPQTHIPSSSSVMSPFFANQSCDPFTDASTPCLIGNYAHYAIDVASPSDISAGLTFAQENNIRVVIRNTGHDFFGRSTGAGSLAIWTNHLKDVEFLDWSDGVYTGKAMKAGAGVLGAEAIEAAHAEGLAVVTGECPTVGLAGGFTQGGGHSALSTTFGLGADNVLEYEVVTASGDIVTASQSENWDLYWALSGGGGGTFGVVTSLTVRAHTDTNVGGAIVQIAAAYTTTENFNLAVSKLHELIPTMQDQGASVVYYVNNAILVIKPLTVWNSTGDYVRDTVLAPFTSYLTELGIPASIAYTTLPYRDHYDTYMGPLPYGEIEVASYNFGGRLIPRSVLENNNDGFQAVLQNLTAHGVLAVGTAVNAQRSPGVNNSVNPAWRNAAVQLQLTTAWDSEAPWSEMVADQTQITDEFMPQIEAVTPGSGSYVNEADFNQPNWQTTFFGYNYAFLWVLKQKWDSNGLLYVLKGVGSERWNVAEDGRMCRNS